MDFETRKAVRRQIDSAMRKRIGISPNRSVSTTAPSTQTTGKTWTNEEIERGICGIARIAGVPREELTLATYCRLRDANRHMGPTRKILRARGIQLLMRGAK